MSLIRAKAIQMGYDATASNNFLIYQPLTPDGTFRIANGNQGATTDIMTVSSAGNVTFAGSTNFASLNFGAGSQSAPSLYPTGDSNTGIWFPAADTFAVSTGGTERIRVDSNGKLTTGTISVGGTAAYLDFTNSTAPSINKATTLSFAFSNSGGLNSANPFWLGHHFASPLVTQGGSNVFPRAAHFYSYTTATDPTDLTYNIWAGNASTLNHNMLLMSGSGGSSYLALGTNGTERLRIASDGKVGIGTAGSNPLTGLDVRGTSATAASTIQVVGNSTSSLLLGQNADGGVIRGQGGNNVLSFWTGGLGDTAAAGAGSERMRINSSGDVLIGSVNVASNTLRYLDVYNTDAGTNAGSILRLITKNVANTATTSVDFVKYKNYGFWISNNETDATNATIFGVGGTERLRIASTGHVGIGTGGVASYRLHVAGSAGDGTPLLRLDATNTPGTPFTWASYSSIALAAGQNLIHHMGKAATTYNSGYFGYRHVADDSTSNHVTIGMHSLDNIFNVTASGKVGIGTTTPSAKLSLVGGMASPGGGDVRDDGMITMTGGGGDYLTIGQYATSRWWIQSGYYTGSVGYDLALQPLNGNVSIGRGDTAANGILHLYRVAASDLYLETGNAGSSGKLIFKTTDNGSLDKYIMMNAYWTELGAHDNEGIRMRNSSGNVKFYVTGAAGNLWTAGSLSKGSGSFRIKHPLPALNETHDLVHSFIEGPQADLIYRGKVALSQGKATVNIDIASGMTDGTFVALCRDVQCFTSNESGWTPVRGKVVGNILTIESQSNTANDEISWMVVGERQDKHMYDTEWTDENGKIIVEPLTLTEEQQYQNSLQYHNNGAR